MQSNHGMDSLPRNLSNQDDDDDENNQPDSEALLNRQSVIKFKGVEDEDDLEREVI